MASTTLRPNAAIEQSKRKLAAQLARIRSRRAAALSKVNAHYDDIEQDWYATVPPEWHVAIREAATRSMGKADGTVQPGDDLRFTVGDYQAVDVTVNGRSILEDGTVKAHNWQKVTIEEGDAVFVDGEKVAIVRAVHLEPSE